MKRSPERDAVSILDAAGRWLDEPGAFAILNHPAAVQAVQDAFEDLAAGLTVSANELAEAAGWPPEVAAAFLTWMAARFSLGMTQ